MCVKIFMLPICLQTNPCQHPIVILRDISEADLRGLLSEDRLQDFLKTAETLQVRGLAENNASAVTVTAATEDLDPASGVSEEERLMLRRRRLMRRRINDSNEDEALDATTTSSRDQCHKTPSSVSAIFGGPTYEVLPWDLKEKAINFCLLINFAARLGALKTPKLVELTKSNQVITKVGKSVSLACHRNICFTSVLLLSQ